jgi:hypothetical protein
MDQSEKQQMYFGGVPTGPDVARIEAVVDLTPGTVIAHHTIEEVIGAKYRTSRYRTVTDAWRKKALRDYNVEIGAETGVGFRVLTEPERVAAMRRRVVIGGRRIHEAVDLGARIDARQLDGHSKAIHESQMRLGYAMRDVNQKHLRAINAEVRATKQLARPDLDE